MNYSPLKFVFALLTAATFQTQPVLAQTPSADVIRGSLFSGTIRGPKANDAIAMKGLVVTVGAEKNAYLCYDADLMRVSLGWTGAFLEFGDTQSKIAWPPPPQVKGTAVFGTKSGPGWMLGGSLADPRLKKQGPLPKHQAHYQGLYHFGDQVVLKYTVNGAEILELPGFANVEGQGVFTRTIQFEKNSSNPTLVIADGVASNSVINVDFKGPTGMATVNLANGSKLVIGLDGLAPGAHLETTSTGHVILKLSKILAHKPFRLSLSSDTNPSGFAVVQAKKLTDLRQLTKGGPTQWGSETITQGVLGTEKEPYVVDTLTEPLANAYNSRLFFGGFDFLSDGRAAICTFHGDVWLVSGLDEKLNKLTWKRYATGLFQPLGLKVVKNTIYVLGRDQITRLHDLNQDDEADYYENFNNDTVVTANYHEFCLDLHTDQEGNFYFAKGAPWEPEVTSPHQGCLIKVAKDGSKIEVVASGFRAPNGMTVGPRDEITVSDNQGHWMPSSKLNWVQKGGFYGMTPAAQKEMKLRRDGTNFVANPSDPDARAKFNFKGWEGASPIPESYDQPMVWLPMSMDNSSGGQVYVTSDKWGPMNGKLLFMSYGKCTIFEVMTDEVDGLQQGAMTQFPLKFYSGLMRARFNPKDGQLYACGLKGWQSNATRDGGFYRVRYTGQPVRMPVAFKATHTGATLSFSAPLNAKTAVDAGNYSAERWNYHYSGSYGSPEFSVSEPTQKKHDKLDVKSVRVSADGKTITLQIDGMKPSDQLKIKYNVDAADGTPLSQEVYATVHKLGS